MTHFAFLLVPEFSHIAFSCAVEPLRIANLVSGQDLYRWSFVSEDGARAVCSNGSVTLTQHSYQDLPKSDRLFVLSGLNVVHHVSKPLLATLRRARSLGVPLGALCSGAWVLAKGGLLDDHKAAIHWEFHDAFAEAFPDVHLVRSVFVADDPIMTASGGTATADLMLHSIGVQHGRDLATEVADQMVYTAVRDGSAQQRVSLQSRLGMRNQHLVRAIAVMQDCIETPKSAAQIADEIGISTRQLERLFGRFLNTSPKKYFLELRLERARRLLVQSEASVMETAIACGFESTGHFARVYKATFGVSPSQQRAHIT